MKSKILHIVPDNRIGGIFIYIKRLCNYNRQNNDHYIFSGQPKLDLLNYINYKPLNIRRYKSFLIIVDLIFNTPAYIIQIMNSEKIFFHTPFLIIHHFFALLLKKDSYLIFHDFNFLFPLKLIIIFLKPRNTFCASEVLKNNLKFLDFTNILPPYYSAKELDQLIKDKESKLSSKSNIIFLGNINKVKQIYEFSEIFIKSIKKRNIKINLSIYGEIVHMNVFKKILNLKSSFIKINKKIPHSSTYSTLRNYKFIVMPSKSEVFPIVYFEALQAGVIPIVNNIDFFLLVSNKNNSHIFSLDSPHTIEKVIMWANNLNDDEYLNYLNILKAEFRSYYEKFSGELKSILY